MPGHCHAQQLVNVLEGEIILIENYNNSMAICALLYIYKK